MLDESPPGDKECFTMQLNDDNNIIIVIASSAGSDFYEASGTWEKEQNNTTKLQEMRCNSNQSLSPHILF